MRIRPIHSLPLLTAAAVAATIAAAPIAAAAPTTSQQNCSQQGLGTVCQTPGNVEITAAPPPVSFDPYGMTGDLLGLDYIAGGNQGAFGGVHNGRG